MLTAKQVKDIAALIGAVSGAIAGIDKTKTILTKWRQEHKMKKLKKEKDTIE